MKLDITSELQSLFVRIIDRMLQAINYAIAMVLWIACFAGVFHITNIVTVHRLYLHLSKVVHTYLAANVNSCGCQCRGGGGFGGFPRVKDIVQNLDVCPT